MTVRLEELLAAATPGPWRGEVDSVLWSDEFMVGGFEKWHDAELAALAPDAVRLLIDTMDALENAESRLNALGIPYPIDDLRNRLDRLGNTT